MKENLKNKGLENLVVEQFKILNTKMDTGFAQVRQDIREIKDTLEPLSKAFDVDTQTLTDHGHRISRLEKKANFG